MVECANFSEVRKKATESIPDYNSDEYLANKNKVVLPALNSNNIAFDIFSFYQQPEA